MISQYLVRRLTELVLRKWFLKIAKLPTFLLISLIRDCAFKTTKSPCGGDFEYLGVCASEWGYCNEADFQGVASQHFLKVGPGDMLYIACPSVFPVTVRKSGYGFFFGIFGVFGIRGQK